MPAAIWDACTDPDRTIDNGTEVIVGFDGSFNGDATALVVATVEDVPHVDVVQLWERPHGARPEWQVPILDVEAAIREACRRWEVREIICDPFRWARTYQVLDGEGLPIVEFPQTPARMTPATTRVYEAAVNKTLTHSEILTNPPHLQRRTQSRLTRQPRRQRTQNLNPTHRPRHCRDHGPRTRRRLPIHHTHDPAPLIGK